MDRSHVKVNMNGVKHQLQSALVALKKILDGKKFLQQVVIAKVPEKNY